MAELFPKRKYTAENIAAVVLAQIFTEHSNNIKRIESSDPFVAAGSFRLNHCLERNLMYNFSEKVKAIINVVCLNNNTWKINYIIQDEDEKESSNYEFEVCGSYLKRQDDMTINYKIKNQVILTNFTSL